MFSYVLKTEPNSEKTNKIKTNFGYSMEDIKHEVLEYTTECRKSKFTYPNGLVIESHVYSDRIETFSNVELVEDEEGNLIPQI